MEPATVAIVIGAGLVVFGAQWIARVRRGSSVVKQLAASFPDAEADGGRLRARFEEEGRAFRLDLRADPDGNHWTLACALRPLRERPRFTRADALDESGPFHRALNPLFAGVVDAQLVHVVDGELVIEASLKVYRFDEGRARAQAAELARLADALERELALEGAERLTCPECQVPLDEARGELHEAVCPDCRGRFLPRAAAERLLGAELGQSPGALKHAAAGTRAVDRCPACAHKMSPVPVEDVIIALCTGCGGAWLDEGELQLLSGGRYAEL